ncbi:MAG: HAMP domain-containing histidine kinase [Streptococcaceae bacterium]|jgi:signal transduction histidine kinase|nr:HAMP domain-containing histidine kinase [Streptococcaceae bacterium]
MTEVFIIIVLSLLLAVFIYLYFALRFSVKRLDFDMLEKMETKSNVLLTLSERNQQLSDLTREINALFDAMRELEAESQQEKDTFTLALHNITHDIRTPLTIASGYTQSMLKSDQVDREDLQKIRQNLDTVAKRLEILLDYQNLLELRIQPTFKLVNLTEIVREQLLKFYESFESAGFMVNLQLTENVMLEADEELLSRVMQNMLGNVLKHGKEAIDVQLSAGNGQIVLTVKNHSQQTIQNLEKLTRRFYSENMSEVEASSGLGLYIIQELVTLLNGNLELDYNAPIFSVVVRWSV